MPGAWDASRGGGGSTSSRVVVAVRVRPLLAREQAAGASAVVFADQPTSSLAVIDPTAFSAAEALQGQMDTQVWTRNFVFDHCFSSEGGSDQEVVFKVLGTQVLENAWAGYNASLFAYGQTGAGKSFSMMGTGAVLDERLQPQHYGLIPRISSALFFSIEQAQAQAHDDRGLAAGKLGPDYAVEVSYLEIYNEAVHDLFNPRSAPASGTGRSSRLRVREHPLRGAYVENLTTVLVTSYAEVGQLMALGGRARTVAVTNMNENSSRSHAIFTINFRQKEARPAGASRKKGRSGEKVSKIHMVDLAGSERVDQTGATGARLREARNINKSLATLCDVVKALASRTQAEAHGTTSALTHIPYRNSVLTWLLKESLGGNARTIMLAAVSPCDVHYDETMSTLKYAERAKRMRTRAVVNAHASDETLIAELRQEVAELKRELARRLQPTAQQQQTLPPIQELPEPEDFGPTPEMEAKVQQLEQALQQKEELIHVLSMSIESVVALREGGGTLSPGHLSLLSSQGSQSSLVAAAAAAAATGRESGVSVSGSWDGGSFFEGDAGSPSPSPTTNKGSIQERAAALKAMGVALPGDKIDPTRPRLVNLNQDPLFSECLVYYVGDGTTVIGSDPEGDIQLSGEDMQDRHAVLTFTNDLIFLCPLQGAATYLNGRLISGTGSHSDSQPQTPQTPTPALLTHRARIVFGRHHVFRFEHPDAAARELPADHAAREEITSGQVIDWEFAQRELAERSPKSPIVIDTTGSTHLELQSLADKVRKLEAERSEYQRHQSLSSSSSSSTPSSPRARSPLEADATEQPLASVSGNPAGLGTAAASPIAHASSPSAPREVAAAQRHRAQAAAPRAHPTDSQYVDPRPTAPPHASGAGWSETSHASVMSRRPHPPLSTRTPGADTSKPPSPASHLPAGESAGRFGSSQRGSSLSFGAPPVDRFGGSTAEVAPVSFDDPADLAHALEQTDHVVANASSDVLWESSSGVGGPTSSRSTVASAPTSMSHIEHELQHSREQTYQAQEFAEQAKKRLEDKSKEVLRLQRQVERLIANESPATNAGALPKPLRPPAPSVQPTWISHREIAHVPDPGPASADSQTGRAVPLAPAFVATPRPQAGCLFSEGVGRSGPTNPSPLPPPPSVSPWSAASVKPWQPTGTGLVPKVQSPPPPSSPSSPMSSQARKLQRELSAMRQRVEVAQRRLASSRGP